MSVTTELLLGIDLGTSSVKAILVDMTGEVLSSGSAETVILHPQPDTAEQDPEEWWQAVCSAVRSTVDAADITTGSIAAIGLSEQMHGTVLLGADGRRSAPAAIWPDRRSVRQVHDFTDHIGAQRLVEIAGSPVATGFQAATLLWIKEQQPQLWQRIRHVLLPKDYIRWRLTGQMATDPSDGSGTLLLDVRTREWSPQLLSALALDPAWLPPVQASGQLAGELTPQAAAQLNLPRAIPVMTGAADTACSALGAGVVDPGTLLLTLSTGGQLVQPVSSPTMDLQGRIHTFCSAFEASAGGAGWYQMGAILAAGLALRWLRDGVFELSGPDAYSRMTGWAEETALGAGGLIFLPYLVGERSPHMDPAARGLFFGLTVQHGRGELVRALLEGITLACYDAYGVLADLGAAPESIVLAGGGARSHTWQRIVANVFGLPVKPLAAAEQSALGAALLAGAGLGWFDLAEEARAWAKCSEPVQTCEADHERYTDLLPLFRAAYSQNAELFRLLAAFDGNDGMRNEVR